MLSLALPAVLVPLALLVSKGAGAVMRATAWGFALGLTGLNLFLLPSLLGA